ncbi:Nicotinamide mononucleotide (NMN) deamidase PncC (PncC) (PDB:2A9S) [Commensalibacter communis]|uniref:Nicotinamide mononucleotide (NMN) deamidase PncC (PncC) n=1 Tax=Commensalibacter communis TaxID=2972786 RepID=A0A9W4TMD2_9PROT|nr:CinA family protein [Commensalibacter communis]CAI3927002.1 Nicotinamide mononucleotide (NMN) deamidase PncC (PncC) (PDB:2A9S) [Commensalibacter communis]CAI3927604.1 Nicotinamide mononucleotide (NMN) deamidase PncC (PncC) (PDB:2A9S) [Commensalibacter communis]CAI3933860.1 Nicotinamide mononucleotide (NMN) deamidase PncC (PncC) (PDB:2A9S) [Commensalibacter communis]CAI3935424.1 Nicotinamide mononucleotide (NMN) deamidase PncC (PncC) (PDB:2A9S) [Commensalibacter communis]CAI3939689.1 Nicotin
MNNDYLKHQLSSLCSEFALFCLKSNLKLVTAESCTAGLMSGYLTDLPGSSAYIEGGFVTYSNEMKAAILGVKQESLEKFGAVSEPVALEMVIGALRKAPMANIAVAVTGFAGPDPSGNSNIGLVWIALQKDKQQATAHQYHFSGNRDEIRLKTIIQAIKLMLRLF